MNIFGRKKKEAPAPVNISSSIQNLREAQDLLEKREKHLEKQIAGFRAEARTRLANKDKRGALALLKKAKLYDVQITQLSGKRSNLEIQAIALEGAASNRIIFDSLRQGQAALKAATASVDVDTVSDVMEDINESMQQQEEINDALSQQIGPIMDEDELNQELADMEQEMADLEAMEVGALPEVKPNISAPAIPARQTVPMSTSSSSSQSSKPVAAKPAGISDKEAKELRELEALMGM